MSANRRTENHIYLVYADSFSYHSYVKEMSANRIPIQLVESNGYRINETETLVFNNNLIIGIVTSYLLLIKVGEI